MATGAVHKHRGYTIFTIKAGEWKVAGLAGIHKTITAAKSAIAKDIKAKGPMSSKLKLPRRGSVLFGRKKK